MSMASKPALSASVYIKDKNGDFQPLDRKTSEAILAVAAKGQRYVVMEWGTKVRLFDLKIMKQLGRGPFDEEEIVIEIPCNVRSSKTAGSFKRDDFIRRKMIEMAVDRIRGEQSISKILDLKDVPQCLIRENPYLGRWHLPYDNFVNSLLAATLSTNSPGRIEFQGCSGLGEMLYDAIVEIASDGPTEASLHLLEKEGLHLVFHGTNEALMENILETGLLPEFRKSGKEDWFGLSYSVSMLYTRRNTIGGKGTKLLLFMVLGHYHIDEDEGMITSDSNRLQLPVAEITVKVK